MLTNDNIANEIPPTSTPYCPLNQKVFNRSALKFLFINRENAKDYDFVDANDTYNRMVGLEYDLNSVDNKWNGRFFTYNSFSPLKTKTVLAVGFG